MQIKGVVKAPGSGTEAEIKGGRVGGAIRKAKCGQSGACPTGTGEVNAEQASMKTSRKRAEEIGYPGRGVSYRRKEK